MICFWHGNAGADRYMDENGEARAALWNSISRVCKAKLPKYAGPVSVRLFMVLDPRTNAQAMIKPCLAALEQAGVITSDRQVKHFSFYRESARAQEQDSIGIAVTAVKKTERKAGTGRGQKAGKRGVACTGHREPQRLRVPAGKAVLSTGS
jgi:hypothetical protein